MSSSELSRIKERSKSRKKLNEIYDNSINAYLIHYSCESFYAAPGQPAVGGSTRVTSIAVRNLKSAQTKTWSIHKSAELKGQLPNLAALLPAAVPATVAASQGNTPAAVVLSPAVLSATLDPLELDMLDGYFSFLLKNSDSTFIHWNMRDDNYGFSALEHRFRVLGGNPCILQDNRKFDLARELVTLYGIKYAPHKSQSGRKGRLMSITEMNRISDVDALQGAAEADAFVNGEYMKLHQSTLRKVDILASVFDRTHNKSLKTNASFTDKYGIHPVAIIEVAKNNPIVSSLIFIATAGVALLNYERIFVALKNMF
jgi:hypothetical protein